MSNLNNILNKLGKIEAINETNLGKHEIELATLDDLKKYVSDSKAFEKFAQEIILNFDNLIKEKNTLQKRSIDIYDINSKKGTEVISKLSNFEKQAKELGLDPSLNPIYQQSEQTFEKNAQLLKKLDIINKTLNK